MTHTSTSQGEVVVENDFSAKLEGEASQLTSQEIIEVNGEFSAGDTILLRTDDGTRIAKAIANYGSCLLNFIAEQPEAAQSSPFLQTERSVISNTNIAYLQN